MCLTNNEFLNLSHNNKYIHIVNTQNDRVVIKLEEITKLNNECDLRSITIEHKELIYILEPLLKYSETTKTKP